MTGLWVLLLTSLACSLAWHAFCRHPVRAVAGATVSSVLLFQGLAWWHLGHIDPLAVVAMVVSLPVAALVALVTGWLWRSGR